MDSQETKRTVPVPSVGADGEQPIPQTTTPSIAEELAENNPQEKSLEERLLEMQRMSDPAYLHTVSIAQNKSPEKCRKKTETRRFRTFGWQGQKESNPRHAVLELM